MRMHIQDSIFSVVSNCFFSFVFLLSLGSGMCVPVLCVYCCFMGFPREYRLEGVSVEVVMRVCFDVGEALMSQVSASMWAGKKNGRRI